MGHTVQQQEQNTLTMERAHVDHAYALAPHLREADKFEFSCNFSEAFPDVASMLVQGLEETAVSVGADAYTICDGDGRILGMWGHSPWESPLFKLPVGAVWLCSTDELFERFPILMTRLAREQVFPRLDKIYSAYGNLVHSGNIVHVRWLASAGFKTISRTQRGGESFSLMLRNPNV